LDLALLMDNVQEQKLSLSFFVSDTMPSIEYHSSEIEKHRYAISLWQD
jgi:hypothetical protein